MRQLKARLRRVLTALRLDGLYTLWHRLGRWDPRRLRRAAPFRRWNEEAGADEIVLRPGLRLAIDPRSREPFEHFCFRSLEMSRELDAFTREMGACRRFLDVGACHGVFALAFAQGRPDALALALDPSPVACSILAANVLRNSLRNVILQQVAAGAAPGRVRMRQVWHHLEAVAETDDPAGTFDLPIEALDDLCARLSFAPDLVKIDVEGYELAVLEGARGVLARHRPRLFLELHPERLRELGGSVQEVVGLLEEIGYRFETLEGTPLRPAAVAARGSVSRLLCAPA
ncbi:MAG TPA: FkbM family methyltransferase [Thermoanaerobaculia bacterium]|nr:FkbM family methyltransferase [Thermoanaerobaculia bacterium]